MFCATEEDTKHLMYALVKDSDSDTVQLNVSVIFILKVEKRNNQENEEERCLYWSNRAGKCLAT